MGRKCSVYGCTSGYKSVDPTTKVSIYRFPDDEQERQEWVTCLPNKVRHVTAFMGICALHWPADVPLVRKKRGRYPTPAVPPSIFPNVPNSCVPSHTSCTPRPTKKALSGARNTAVDQMSAFREQDIIKTDSFQSSFLEYFSHLGFISFNEENCVLLSKDRCGAVHTFAVYVTSHKNKNCVYITYEAYFGLKKIFHPSFRCDIHYWSQLRELIRFVKSYSLDEEDLKLKYINQAIEKYNCAKNKRIYTVEDFVLAFSWYARSRALYTELRQHLQLPSLSTLRKITSVAKSLEDFSLFKAVFKKLDRRSRGCVLIIDEVYVKASLSYRGGSVFGYAQDIPGKLATTFLCIMVKCFFGSKSFLVKLLPCHALTSQFQYTAVRDVITSLEDCGAQVLALICDNNRVNQRFFSLFKRSDESSPWVVESPVDSSRQLFLIYDPVHILKNIRNSWITEKTQRINFYHDGTKKTASWSDIRNLYDFESKHLLKLSALTKSAVMPNNIEKQKVSLALQVFSEKTSSALKSSSSSSESYLQTAAFIDEVLLLWKVFNCKTPLQYIFQIDPDRAPIDLTSQGNRQVETLLAWAEIAKSMEPSQHPRQLTLTRDTAKALQWTCRCLVALSKHLLHTDAPYVHQYVTLGFFQQDDIERHFAHFRMSAGNNYYINAQDVLNTHAIDRTKLMLEVEDGNIDHTNASHKCKFCDLPLTDLELLCIDDLPQALDSLSRDEKMSIIYIGGYICQKHPDYPCFEGDPSLFNDASVYTDYLNRGGLRYPSQDLFQLLCLIYLFFRESSNSVEHSCRKRFINIFSDFPAIFHIELALHSTVLSRIVNIILKRICIQHTSADSESKKRKVAKLSSQSQAK